MRKLFLCLFLILSSLMQAQKFKNEKGDLNFLKGTTEMNVIFKYDNLRLMKENYTEEEYIKSHKSNLNEKEKGLGEIWIHQWNNAKSQVWEPKFLLLLNKYSNKKITYQLNDSSAKYTMIVDVVWLYPGWDAFMMRQPAKVTTKIQIVDTNDMQNVLYEVESIDAPGNQFGSNFNNETRLGEGFAKTAKTLTKKINKYL